MIIQEPHESRVSNLVTAFDSFISSRQHHMMRLVITTDEHIQVEPVAHRCGYELLVGPLNPEVPSQVWIDGNELLAGHPWPGWSGHENTMQAHCRTIVLPDQPQSHEELSLLQHAQHVPRTLALSELIPNSDEGRNLTPIKLISISCRNYPTRFSFLMNRRNQKWHLKCCDLDFKDMHRSLEPVGSLRPCHSHGKH